MMNAPPSINDYAQSGDDFNSVGPDQIDTGEFEQIFKKWVTFVKATRPDLAEKTIRDMASRMAADEYNNRTAS